MNEQDKGEFAQIVRATFNNYSREAPMQETLRMWWGILAEFDIGTVRVAFSKHITTEPKFPPTIGQILEILNAGSKFGRLGAEEAWALAVKACDESETVVMNDEIAQAWGICKPIMDLGDEVGARMAFKEAYQRITASATAPVKWWPSIGSDPHKRDAALSEAKRQGLLPAPQVAGLLPPATQIAESGDAGSPEGLRRLKEEMARLRSKGAAEAEQAARERQQAREAEAHKKAVIAERVAQYEEKA
ncbi:replicative helicase loader/inhibitor [Cupriavidus sp. 2KB_3]|uniref:hypothetical protein n=1 Tax=Cupriavidus sp. 2KB_3 TaxID=3232980 RepID=UPI003F8FAFC7